MIEFIHCGDLHLGCAPARLEERYLDFFNAFDRLIDYAIINNVGIIVVSGDFFHLKNLNSKTLQNTLNCLNKAKEKDIKVIVIEGNHDKAFYVDEDSWLDFLNKQKYIILLRETIKDGNIKLLNHNMTKAIYEEENIRFIGISYMGGSTEKYLLQLNEEIKKEDKYTVLLLHAGIDKMADQDMARVKSEVIDTLKDKIDYVALGHIHYQYEYDDYCYNPGSLENIRIKDAHQGMKKGFYHIKIDEHKNKEVIYINSNYRPVLFKSVDATGITTPNEIFEEIKNMDYKVNENEMMELSIYGKVDFNPYLINVDEISTYLKEKYNLLYIEVNNHINTILSNENNERVDIKTIVNDLICKEIKYNFPEKTNAEVIANEMMNVSEMLENNNNFDTIIDFLLKNEVKL